MKKIWGFINRTYQDHVAAYSAQAAYYLILSFIPFILFLTTLIRYTPVTYNQMREAIISVVPQSAQSFVMEIVAEVYRRNSALVPISAIVALWSAGKGLQAITNGLNMIYHVKETRNWLVNRIKSVFYTLLFCVSLIISLLFMVLGRQLQQLAEQHVPLLGRFIGWLISFRMLPILVILFLVFLILFRFLPNRKATLLSQVPGAVLTAFAWVAFSYLFSLYFELFPGFSNMYGSLTALIIVMLWINFLMNLMLYGAEINTYFETDFVHARESIKQRRTQEKEQKQEQQEEHKEQNQK